LFYFCLVVNCDLRTEVRIYLISSSSSIQFMSEFSWNYYRVVLYLYSGEQVFDLQTV